ncbi:hypothetical protein BJX66DRAFT_342951 [Aspergillus keveii]|uniref:Uncharacterized protein n=1 Tax=Aspergillus keveii TaxID=714993 RepID=A0ABR4FQR5_9EURO
MPMPQATKPITPSTCSICLGIGRRREKITPYSVKSDHGPISHKITVPAHYMLIIEADEPQSEEENWVHYYHTRVDHEGVTYSLTSSDVADEYNRRLWLTSKERVARIPFDKKELVERLARAVAPQRCQWYVIALLESIENEGLLPGETASGLRYSVEMSAGQQFLFRYDDGVPVDLRVRANIVREAFERFWRGAQEEGLTCTEYDTCWYD